MRGRKIMDRHRNDGAPSQIWRMVRADLVYNKTLFIVLYGLFLTFALFNVIYGRLERFMLQIVLISIAMIGISAGSEEVRTKGIRRMVLIPVSIGRMAVYRQVILVGYVLSLIGLIILSSVLAGKGWPEPGFLLRVVSMSGLLFIITSGMDIFFNMKHVITDSGLSLIARGIVLAIVLASVAVYVFFMNIVGKKMDLLAGTLTAVFTGPAAAVILIGVGLGMIILTGVFFRARKRFAE